jgi:DNA-binding CsgD family transcriptional regulator
MSPQLIHTQSIGSQDGDHAAMLALEGQITTREGQILQLVAEGMTDKEVARNLGISKKTVGTHLGRLFTRHGFHSRTQAVVGWLAILSAISKADPRRSPATVALESH